MQFETISNSRCWCIVRCLMQNMYFYHLSKCAAVIMLLHLCKTIGLHFFQLLNVPFSERISHTTLLLLGEIRGFLNRKGSKISLFVPQEYVENWKYGFGISCMKVTWNFWARDDWGSTLIFGFSFSLLVES